MRNLWIDTGGICINTSTTVLIEPEKKVVDFNWVQKWDHNLPTWMHPCNWPNRLPNHSKIFGFGWVTMMFTGILEWRQKNKIRRTFGEFSDLLGHFLEKSLILRKFQQAPGTDPRYPKIQIWKDFFHKQVVQALGYVPGVCWNFLRLILNHLYFLWSQQVGPSNRKFYGSDHSK